MEEEAEILKAWVLEDVNKLNFKDDVAEPPLQDDEVLVAVEAAGICGSDIARIYQDGAHQMPLIPGHEFSGKVVKLGKKADGTWLGKRVAVFPLIPCKSCDACRARKYEMCAQYSYLGSRTDGGFAEFVAVPDWNLLEIPDHVTYEQAAMFEPMAVAVHSMRRLTLSQDAAVAVCGLGTIGQLMIMFLLEQGIKNIYAIGSKESQIESITMMGVPHNNCCNSSKVDMKSWIDQKTEQRGIEVFFECVGKNETIALAIDCMAPAGQLCLVGNPYSDIMLEKNIYWKILRRQLTVTGTWNSSYLGANDEGAEADDWNYVMNCLKQGRIAPEKLITHRFDLAGLAGGLEIMKCKTEPYTKIIMSNQLKTEVGQIIWDTLKEM
jgi:L-iditol 2-dehydrogenase